MTDLSTVIHEFVVQQVDYKNLMIETHIKFILKPKPKFVPQKLWYKLAAKFLVIHEQ